MRLFFTTLLFVSSFSALAQELDTGDTLSYFRDGINYKYDPAHFSAHFRFRMQNRFTYQTEEAMKLSAEETNFEVRRTRFRLEGHVLDPRLLYKIQLSFTRGDFDFDRTEYPNILRDAAVGWRFTDRTTLWYGQTKLPGNRQRLVSSGSQQFVDRSIVNSTFNIDRDIGVQLNHRAGNEMPLWIKLAISNGEGRSTNNKDSGLAYTARMEWLPLGAFKDGGDYLEGDQSREIKPKLSMALAYSSNKKTTRPGGQLGTQYETDGLHRDIDTFFADFLFKYQGFAWTTEYAKRWTQDPTFTDTAAGKSVVIYKGQGINTQASYIFENNVETALRFSRIWGDKEIRDVSNETHQYTIAASKYINEHTVKIQTDLSYTEDIRGLAPKYKSYWVYRLQLEIGI